MRLLPVLLPLKAVFALAVGMKTKSKTVKTLSFSSAVSAFLGITEPAIFGVNLRYVKPFFMALVGGAAGGFIASILQLARSGDVCDRYPGTPLYLNGQLFGYLLANGVAIAVAFALTYMFGFKDEAHAVS